MSNNLTYYGATNGLSTNYFALTDRVFLDSNNINIFPCSRRGQKSASSGEVYDPESRLNTERTNRLRTANKGLKDSFIIDDSFTSEDTELKFILGGYYIEVKNFKLNEITSVLGVALATGIIYTHLSLHTGIEVGSGYDTEILYRQIQDESISTNYLDVRYSAESDDDLFTGVSFAYSDVDNFNDAVVITDGSRPSYNLPIFKNSGSGWELAIDATTELGETQVSSLTASDRITAASIITNSLSVENIDSVNANSVTADSITQNGNPVPTINLNQTGSTWQLQITLDASKREE